LVPNGNHPYFDQFQPDHEQTEVITKENAVKLPFFPDHEGILSSKNTQKGEERLF
jgi:hypothetical protein